MTLGGEREPRTPEEKLLWAIFGKGEIVPEPKNELEEGLASQRDEVSDEILAREGREARKEIDRAMRESTKSKQNDQPRRAGRRRKKRRRRR